MGSVKPGFIYGTRSGLGNFSVPARTSVHVMCVSMCVSTAQTRAKRGSHMSEDLLLLGASCQSLGLSVIYVHFSWQDFAVRNVVLPDKHKTFFLQSGRGSTLCALPKRWQEQVEMRGGFGFGGLFRWQQYW